MPLTLSWTEIAWRLLLTVVAGALLGANRSERGRPAGLRTTLLVCLAASVSMIQVNLLLGARGKEPDSFVVMDLLRLPLGILTGMGFIGGGAILRKGSLIQGITTAATLWLATVVGLCFGGGQEGLGVAATTIGLGTLWALAPLEGALPRQHRATLTLVSSVDSPAQAQVQTELSASRYKALAQDASYAEGGAGALRRTLRWEVQWRGHIDDKQPPAFLERCAQLPGVFALTWKIQGG
jgi:putative Mg2+ transporter-C (MgtC) family protein